MKVCQVVEVVGCDRSGTARCVWCLSVVWSRQ